jgi:hypothetical protein
LFQESDDSNERITPYQAFLAMTDYVWWFASRADRNDMVQLIGDTFIEADGSPTDPAAWGDWLESVDRIRKGIPPRHQVD